MNRSELERFFADISSRIQPAQTDLAHGSSARQWTQRELERFFADVNYRVHLAETLQRQLDVRLATGFNVFDLIEPDENKLSDVLAGLLDPKGNHGQGDLFLRLLFERLGLRSDAKLTKDATVQREAPMRGTRKDHRRMDVFVKQGYCWLSKIRWIRRSNRNRSRITWLTWNGAHATRPADPEHLDLPDA